MFFARIFIVFTLALFVSTQMITTRYFALPSMPTAVQSYLASVTTQPAYSSAINALASAMPSSETDTYALGGWPAYGTAPSWFSAVPNSYASYISSFRAVEISLMTRTAEGPAPTSAPRMKVVGAALAVGAGGLAML